MTTKRTAATTKLQQIAQDRHRALESARIERLEDEARCPNCHELGEPPYNWPVGRYFRCTTPDCAAIAYFVHVGI
jgi:hypothetical protein